ncbi:MAG: methyltransferase [Crocinitomicaceae bacterium]|nr:methyltransferase [Crocinitomicaceae bacterium]|tara:strand:- start:6586 stop:7227 length:642 start_codon:yes stop_codon:yes gene_type:complete
MDFIDSEIEKYALSYSSKESDLLYELNRQTHIKILQPRMLSGHLQGRFLSMISKALAPVSILEIGTYTGYSALCLAEGLSSKGCLTTIDKNEELEAFAKTYFEKSTFKSQIKMHVGNALDIIPTLHEKWDLVFIDADKENYSNYFDLVVDNVRQGGWIIADNVLWSGKVLSEVKSNDLETESLKLFNAKVHEDNRVTNLLLPIRDGLMILIKN